jgi:transposase
MNKYIGLDMDSKKIAACVVDETGQESYQTLRPQIGEVRRFFQQQRDGGHTLHAAYEISGQAGWWYDNLIDTVDRLVICNPTKTTWIFRTTKKNDQIDARKMAVLLRIGELPLVHMPDASVRQWRQTIRHRRELLNQLTRIKNQIRSLLKSQGIMRFPHGRGWWTKANQAWMQSLATETAPTEVAMWRVLLSGLVDQWTGLDKQIHRVTRHLDQVLAGHPDAQYLLSIPGVGPRTAEAVLAYTDDIHRFQTGKQYGSYFGLTPKLDESGSTRRLGHISKQGPSVVRWLLVESAWRAIRYCPPLKAFFERVRNGQADRTKIAIVAVARKLTEIMRALLLTHQMYDQKRADPRRHQETHTN